MVLRVGDPAPFSQLLGPWEGGKGSPCFMFLRGERGRKGGGVWWGPERQRHFNTSFLFPLSHHYCFGSLRPCYSCEAVTESHNPGPQKILHPSSCEDRACHGKAWQPTALYEAIQTILGGIGLLERHSFWLALQLSIYVSIFFSLLLPANQVLYVVKP